MKTQEAKIFIVALTIGTLLRFFAIGQRDFWFDEAFSYHIAQLPVKDLIAASLTDNNPPLYYLLLHYILKISDNEIALRLPSLILNIFAIYLIYSLFKTQINKKVATIAASLFSLSPLAIYTATEARPHGPAVIFTLLISMAFFMLIKKSNIKYSIIFIFLAIIGIFVHFYTLLLFLPFTFIVVFGKSRIKILRWLLILAIILLAISPWFFFSIQKSHSDCACPPTLLSLPASLVSPFIGGVGEVTIRIFPTLSLLVILLFGIVTLITSFLFLKGLAQNRVITLLYLMPLGALSFFGIFLPVFSPKAFSISSPFYFIIVALGIASFRKSGLITLLIGILLITINIIQLINPFFAGTRLKPLHNIVKENRSVTVAHTSLLTYYSLNYYSERNQKHILITQNPLSVQTLKFIGGEKQEVDPKSENLWLVDTQKWTEAKDRENALKIVFDAYYPEKTYKIDKITVILLKQK